MERRTLNDEARLDWLQFIRSENVGPVTFHALIAKFGTASRALEAIPELRRGSPKPIRLAKRADCARERDRTYKYGAKLIASCEPDYPEALAAIPDAPPVIAVHGRAEILHGPCVGMVGARNASANGRRFAAGLARELGAAGLTIASGLARGIDTAAHEGSLATGTIACIAGGIDHAYPPENAALMARIAAEGGCVVAEQPFGLKPTARHFPYRNRVIAGLSRAVIVVEAALKSGSLITARLAAEQGRDVLAVPGSPLDPRSAGSNGLIRDGAALVASGTDVLATLGTLDSPFEQKQRLSRLSRIENSAELQPSLKPKATLEPASASQDKLLDLIGFSPVSIDELARQAHLSAAAVAAAILDLELAGRVERHPGAQISLAISKS